MDVNQCKMELLPFVDILKVFNNPINEEQAWAVCYQCAHFLYKNPTQEFYQDVCDSGIHSIWLNRHGDVLMKKGPQDPNGSGKGPPEGGGRHHGSTFPLRQNRRVIATETDAVQALGTSIFEALDYGIEASEERQLSAGLESLIATMTSSEGSMDVGVGQMEELEPHQVDDEGIEKDADLDLLEHRCGVMDVIKICSQHLSTKQDAHHHYKAVCRALATEAGELFTFLDKISSGREKLSETEDEDAKHLEELRRADWACLWVQVMRSLRQGVRLKKIEHVHQSPLEYELTPFEMILEDIRSRRYTLHKIMVNGDIPHKVKNDAHAVILNFIRSRPPLKKVVDRKLKPKQPSPPDPHERLLRDIRSQPKLRPVKEGRLVVETSRSRLNSEDELEAPLPAKRVLKPDFSLFNNSFDLEESSDDDDHHHHPYTTDQAMTASTSSSSPDVCTSSQASSSMSWRRAVTRENLLYQDSLTSSYPQQQQQQQQQPQQQRPSKLQRRHTIMVCESPADGKVGGLQELPPLEEEEEPSPIKESHSLASLSSLPKRGGFSGAAPKPYYSDLDLSQVTLRHPPGQGRRAVTLEHRRSLTSLPKGLSAIPELEDTDSHAQPSASSSSSSSSRSARGGLVRSKSIEHAPPPNPSPPCKARARMASFKPGPSQVSHRQLDSRSLIKKPTAHHAQSSSATSCSSSSSSSSSFAFSQHPANFASSSFTKPRSNSLPLSSSSPFAATAAEHDQSLSLLNSTHAQLQSDSSSGQSDHLLPASSNYLLQENLAPPPQALSSSLPPSPSSSSTSSSLPSTLASTVPSPSTSFSLSSSTMPPPPEPSPSLSRPSISSSSPHCMPSQNNQSAILDSSVSSQSPFYWKNAQAIAVGSSSSKGSSDQGPLRFTDSPDLSAASRPWVARWMNPEGREQQEDKKSKARRQGVVMREDASLPNSPLVTTRRRLSASNASREDLSHRRRSLDSSISLYTDIPADPSEQDPRRSAAVDTGRRVSTGDRNRNRRSDSGRKLRRSSEVDERIERWKTLQEEELARRRASPSQTLPSSVSAPAGQLRILEESPEGEDYEEQSGRGSGDELHRSSPNGGRTPPSSSNSSPCHPRRQEGSPRKKKQQQCGLKHHKDRISPSARRMLCESPDMLRSQMEDQQARLARWRHLEESGGGLVPARTSNNNGNVEPPDTDVQLRDLEFVSGRVVPAVPGGDSLLHTTSSSYPDSECPRHLPSSHPNPQHGQPTLPKRWQNPVECLSLTLEEVTHIRSVLTKAELESLIAHPDLYQMVVKGKLCFTCKTTRFSLFGEWGTKCKFCKRTVCSKCLRKMNVPADHFQNIPVYALSPTPLSVEVQEFIQNYIKNAPATSVPVTRHATPTEPSAPSFPSEIVATTTASPTSECRSIPEEGQENNSVPAPSSPPSSSQAGKSNSSSRSFFIKSPSKPLQRSQSALVKGHKPTGSTAATAIKGPVMAICCDCKGMVTEIIRASKASLAIITGKSHSPATITTTSSAHTTAPNSSPRVLAKAHSFRH